MTIKPLALAALLALGTVSAQAAALGDTIGVSFNDEMGLVDTDADGESFGAAGLGPGSFSYSYQFSLDQLSDLSGSLVSLFGPVTFSSVSLSGSDYALSETNTFSFEDLAAGDYTMIVSGKTANPFYAWSGNLNAQPVPEPQAYAMLLAGLAVMVGVAARRRQA